MNYPSYALWLTILIAVMVFLDLLIDARIIKVG